MRNQMFCNLPVNFCRFRCFHIDKRLMLPFHNIIYIRNMNTFIITATHLRKIFIYFR